MAALKILQTYFSARPNLLNPGAGTPSDREFMLLIYGLLQLSSVSVNYLVCCFVLQNKTPDSRIPNVVGALCIKTARVFVSLRSGQNKKEKTTTV